MEDDVDVWCYRILQLHARNDDDDTVNLLSRNCVQLITMVILLIYSVHFFAISAFWRIHVFIIVCSQVSLM